MFTRLAMSLLCLVLSGCLEGTFPAWENVHNPEHDADEDGFRELDGDCDDDNADIHPAAPERCNDTDDNCNGVNNENPVDAVAFYVDADGDGFGQLLSETWACEKPAGPYVEQAGDCDDSRADVNPDALEYCDGGTDEDCDELVDILDDSMVGDATWYQDLDGDGHGNAEVTETACFRPDNFVAGDQDCNDGSARVHPGHEEICDGIDNDCDGDIDDDDEDGVGDAATWYADTDADGFGDASITEEACEAPTGYVADPGNGAFD